MEIKTFRKKNYTVQNFQATVFWISLALFLLFFSLLAFSQNTFQKTFGGTGNDQANAVLEITGGGYIIAGSTESFGFGLSDMYLVRIDTSGAVLWSKTYGGTNDEYGNAVKQTLDGGFIIAGSTGTFPAGSAGVDLYLVKTDANGNTQWSKTVDMSSSNNQAFSVLQTADSGFVAGGVSAGEYYLVKTDVNGNLLWTHTYGLGPENDDFEDMAQTTDGGFILAGITFNVFTNAGFGAYIVKTDSAGNAQWSKAYAVSPPGNPTWGTNECRAVTIAEDGNILISTESDNVISSSGVDILVFKVDNNGNMLWTGDAYGWADPSFETAWDIVTTTDGGSVEGGQATGTIFGAGGNMLLLKRDSVGVLQWAKTYGGTGQEVANSLQQTSDGGYILAGHTNSFGAGNRDIYLVKTDANGNSSGCNQQDVNPPAGPPLITNDTGIVSSTGGIISAFATIVTIPPTLDSLLCQPIANFYCDTNICAGNCIAFYDITANDPASWQWSFAGGTPSSSTVQHPANICYNVPGTYTVQLIAYNAISSDTAQRTITVFGNNLTMNITSTTVSCGNCNGTVTATPAGGSGNYTYLWNDPNGTVGTAATATGLCAGNYLITITESDTADFVFWSENFTNGGQGWVLNNNGPGVNGFWPNFWAINSLSGCSCGTGNFLHITCGNTIFNCVFNPGTCIYNPGTSFDPVTDKIAVSPSIATTGKTNIKLKFKWIANGEAGDDFGKLRLSNDGGATWTELATPYSGSALCGQDSIILPAIYENITDFKMAFRWINSGNGIGSDPPFGIDDIELSSPSVSGSCSLISNVTLNSSSGLTVSVTTVNATCGSSNGSATATPGGGTSPYAYLWSNGQTSPMAAGLAAGNYQVTVTDSAGCTITATATISIPNAPTVTTSSSSVSCNGGNDGSATLTVTGGTSPYSYLWNTGVQAQNIASLTPGIYYVTVTDSSGCVAIDSATVTQPASFSISTNITDAACGQNNGSIAVIVSGGTIPYSYNWSNGQTGITDTALVAGNYFVTITDSSGCDTTINVTVNNTGGIVPIITASGPTTFCDGDSVLLTATAGATYLWSNGDTTQSIMVLTSGNYLVTVTDTSGCFGFSAATSVTVNSLPNVLLASFSNACINDSVYALTGGNPAGGTYSGTGVSGNNFNPSLAGVGNHTITYSYTDGTTGCSNTATNTITVLSQIDASIIPAGPYCATDNSDTLSATNSGGNWSGPGISTSGIFNPLAAGTGTHQIIYAISGNCGNSDTVQILVSVNPVANAGTDVSIFPGESVTLNGTGGGIYQWTPSNGLSCTDCASPLASPMDTTIYILMVRDANGCTSIDSVTVTIDVREVKYVPNCFHPMVTVKTTNSFFMAKE